VTGAFPAAIIGLGAWAPSIIIGGVAPDITIGAGAPDITIGAGAPDIVIGGVADISIGAGLIMTIDTGEPESITLVDGFFTRVSSPTPTSALSTGRGDGETFGPLL